MPPIVFLRFPMRVTCLRSLGRARLPIWRQVLLNRNHSHDFKNIFKDAATDAGPLQDFYEALVAKGVLPEMERLTLARLRGTKLLP